LAEGLLQAIAALDSLHHTLTTFLPRYLLDRSPTPGQPHGERIEGTFIFADVTGFTALTGELSRRGSAGLEEMNRLMSALFAAVLEPLITSGGDLLIFAGDAVLAFFPARPEGQDARWAARTALRLVRAIAPFAALETPYGTFSLTMSAGVERGQAFAATVGTRQRMELLISGGPVQGAMQAESAAAPGQVYAGPGVLPFLPPETFLLRDNVILGLRGEEIDDYEPVPPARRRRRLSAVFSRRIPDLLANLEETLAQVERVAPFIPPDLFTQIARGEEVRQHPPVAVQFVNLLGVEELALGPAGPQQAAAALQRYFTQAQEIVAEREGIISQVDPYARGFTLLNPFGAPTHHEGVPRLAASAALELGHALERVNREFALDPPLTQRVGLTYDRIFTGEIGYRHRREYVVAGPAVNLAARLMSKAEPGQVVLDPIAWEAVQAEFQAEPLPPIPLKGIPAPVPRFALRGLRRGRGVRLTDYPLVGRRQEMAALEQRLDQAAAGNGSTIALIGQAGDGKSRLAAALAETARRRGFAVLNATAYPFAQATPYLPWAGLVRERFEMTEDAPPEAQWQNLRRCLASLDLTPYLSAFADLLGLPPARMSPRAGQPAPGSGPGLFARLGQQAQQQADAGGLATLLTGRLSQANARQAEDRASIWDLVRERASIPQAIRRLLERQVARQPTLLLFEDLQWADPESRTVLEAIVAAAPAWPLLLLVTARPETEWSGDRWVLPPLSDDESRALAAFGLRATGLEESLSRWLLERAGGNPLFLLSYCRALRDAAAVVVDAATGEACWSGPPPPLPLLLHELLLAQVEQSSQETREMARRGAVLGTTFAAWLLTGLCSDSLGEGLLDEALSQAAHRSLIAPPPPSPTYTFTSHALADAVYSTLSHAQRAAWHERAGDLLSQTDTGTRYERLEAIAYHYSRSADPLKAARFSRLAGDKARTRQADEAALAFYAQALAVSGGPEVAVERCRALEGRGDVHTLHNAAAAARLDYQAALQDGSPDARRLRVKLALLAPLDGGAEPSLLAALRASTSADDPLSPWLGAALVWLLSEQDPPAAVGLCHDLISTVGEPVRAVLEEAAERLNDGEALFPYADLVALFARSCLRLPPGDL